MKSKHVFILICLFLGIQFGYASPDSLNYILKYDAKNYEFGNYNDAADWLWHIPGMWPRELNTFGQWRSFRLDGSQTDQTQITLNGFPLVESWLGTPDLAWIPTSMIESINISPDAGNIDFQAYPAPESAPYTRILYRKGSRDYSVTDVSYGMNMTRNLQFIGGVVFSKLGTADTTYQSQKHRGQTVHLNLDYHFSDQWKLKYQYLHNRLDNHLPFKLPPISDSLMVNHVHTERYDHGLGLTGSLANLWIQFQWAHASHQYQFYRWQNKNVQSVPTQTNTFQLMIKRIKGKADLNGKLSLQDRSATVTNHKFSDLYLMADLTSRIQLNQPWSFSLNLNALTTPDSKTEPGGSLGLTWSQNSETQVTLLFGKYIRTPTLGEKFGHPYSMGPAASYIDWQVLNGNNGFSKNRKLENERIYKSSLQIKWQMNKNIKLYTRAWYRYVENLIFPVYNEGGITYMDNRKNHQFLGLSSEINVHAFWGFEAGGTLNVLQARDWEDENLLERPTLWSSGYLRWKHAFFENDLIAAIQFSIRQWTDFYSMQSDITDDNIYYYHNSQVLLFVKSSFRILQNAVISYGMDNLMDVQTSLVNGILLPGRTSKISVTWEMFN